MYVILTNLMPGDKGTVQFFTPNGILYEEIGFNGEVRDSQKKYFKPQLLKSKNLCEKEDLVGEWTVMFEGYDRAVLHFEMMPDILPNSEYQFVECAVAYVVDPTSKDDVVDPSERLP